MAAVSDTDVDAVIVTDNDALYGVDEDGPSADVSACNLATTQVYLLLDGKSSIDPRFNGDQDELFSKLCGDVDANDVVFEYPIRPKISVLRGLSLSANTGETVAIVGQSGHGK